MALVGFSGIIVFVIMALFFRRALVAIRPQADGYLDIKKYWPFVLVLIAYLFIVYFAMLDLFPAVPNVSSFEIVWIEYTYLAFLPALLVAALATFSFFIWAPLNIFWALSDSKSFALFRFDLNSSTSTKFSPSETLAVEIQSLEREQLYTSFSINFFRVYILDSLLIYLMAFNNYYILQERYIIFIAMLLVNSSFLIFFVLLFLLNDYSMRTNAKRYIYHYEKALGFFCLFLSIISLLFSYNPHPFILSIAIFSITVSTLIIIIASWVTKLMKKYMLLEYILMILEFRILIKYLICFFFISIVVSGYTSAIFLSDKRMVLQYFTDILFLTFASNFLAQMTLNSLAACKIRRIEKGL
jgi:hypothetical protein